MFIVTTHHHIALRTERDVWVDYVYKHSAPSERDQALVIHSASAEQNQALAILPLLRSKTKR
jgi:hypothetical protein